VYDQIGENKLRSAALIVVFIALVAAIGWVFGEFTGWGAGGLAVALVVAAFMTLGSYWYSDRIVLSISRARPVDRDVEPYLVNTVEGLAIAAGLPLPRAYVIDDPAPNAFATGRNPENAAIAVTTGLMEKLDRLELEGVIAHELSHIKNYDTLIQTLAAVLGGTVVLLSDWLRRTFFWGGGRRREGGGQAQAILLLVGLALAVLAPLFAMMLQMAISRKREYLADASAALLTRYPPGLAGALRKIASDPNRLAVANKATESLYIYNPLKDYRGGRGINALFNTHPPIDERIRRLEAM